MQSGKRRQQLPRGRRGGLGLFARAHTSFVPGAVIATFGNVLWLLKKSEYLTEWEDYGVGIPDALIRLHLPDMVGKVLNLIPAALFSEYRRESTWADGREKGALCNAALRGEGIDATLNASFANGEWAVELLATRSLTLRGEDRELLVDYGADYQSSLEHEGAIVAARTNTNQNLLCKRCGEAYNRKLATRHMACKRPRAASRC